MIRNKLQVYLINLTGSKTLTNVKMLRRQITGKKVDKLKMRAPIIDVKHKLESFQAKSREQAEKILSKFNIKKVSKALYYDNEGHEHLIYEIPKKQ